MKPTFEPTDDGLEIIDRIERHRYRLTTHGPVSLEPVDTDEIQYPVDSAVRITTDTLTLPTTHYVYVRDETGAMVAEVKPEEQTFLPEGEYTLDLSGSLKIYSKINSSIQIYSDPEQTHVTLDGPTSVTLGARSYHTRPAQTVTTTAEPTDMMKAISTFGSVLKTTTAERSYPTLRGHPPAVELKDEMSIPDGLEIPETDIQIEVQPKLRQIFIVSSLAYYLGAEIISGSKARLTTGTGFTYALDENQDLETTAERVLKQIFFLDTVVRTEGTTPLPHRKRSEIEGIFEQSTETIHEQPISKQVQLYLSVPHSKLKPLISNWQFETQVPLKHETVEFLPYIANGLSPIKTNDRGIEEVTFESKETDVISAFTRGDDIPDTDSVPRTQANKTDDNPSASPLIRQSWGESSERDIVSTVPLSAFQNNIGRSPQEDPIDIQVICNDENMTQESDFVDKVYGNRNELPFDVTIHCNTSQSELKGTLTSKSDFLHYIGHIDKEGYQCTDGKLNGSDIKESNIKAFFLNACQSHAQGLHLIESGSIGGIVTLGNVVNSGAVRVGKAIAQLLNQGFPLYGALDIAQKESLVGSQYHIVGDGKTTIAQSDLVVPNVCIVEKEGDRLLVSVKMYDSVQAEIGTMCTPYLEPIDEYYVVPGETEKIPIEKPQFEDFLNQGKFPVVIGKNVYWSDSVLVESL